MSRKSKQTKKQTVKEFKAWLSGILEFQPDNWCPTTDQWQNIQDKINNLEDDVVGYVNPQQTNMGRVPTVHPQARPAVEMPRPLAPRQSLMEHPSEEVTIIDQPGGTATPIRLLDVNGFQVPVPEGQPLPPELAGKVTTVASRVVPSGERHKTPSDISDKPYKSPYA